MHPDLANTLNNLGVVYEPLERPADAERCYRRAFAIASAVLDPNHPFVTLSATNLRDFCLARIPFDRPLTTPPAPVSAARGSPHAVAPEATAAVAPEPTAPVAPEATAPVAPEPIAAVGPDFSRPTLVTPESAASRKNVGLVVVAAAVVLALVAIWLVATRSQSTGGAEAPPPQ